MSRRIWKLYVASLLIILCFPAADTGGRRPLARGRFTNAPNHCTGSKVTPGSRRAEASVALDIKGLSDLTLPHVSGEIQNSEAFNVM